MYYLLVTLLMLGFSQPLLGLHVHVAITTDQPSPIHEHGIHHRLTDHHFVHRIHCLHKSETFWALVAVILNLMTTLLMLGLLPPFPVFQAFH
jgi:hypothetical protein